MIIRRILAVIFGINAFIFILAISECKFFDSKNKDGAWHFISFVGVYICILLAVIGLWFGYLVPA